VSELKIGYARVSTEAQDLTAQRDALQGLGVEAERIYVYHGLTGTATGPFSPRLWRRTREGMKVAKAKGRLRGKQPKLSPTQEAHLVKLYRAGEHTVSELEELFAVTRSTVYRTIRRAGGRAGDVPSDAAA
jgi:DNA invertase Pin-like site-specific DNA recombinase